MSRRTLTIRLLLFAVAMICIAATAANSTVVVTPLFGTNMVLQRNKPVPVWGTAAAGESVSVQLGTGTKYTTTADAQGNWVVTLPAMSANATGQSLVIKGTNTITLTNVVVGDVWVCSGQSNMDMGLGSCNRQVEDVDTANFPGIRHFRTNLVSSADPVRTISGSWAVCNPTNAPSFSATAFYFARKIYQDQNAQIPIGLVTSSVGGTTIDLWVAPEGIAGIPTISPLLNQANGEFCYYNGMVYPVSPYAVKGMLWYQGENAERSVQSADSYYLKMKAIAQGWKSAFESDDFAFYLVQIARWGNEPTSATPVLNAGGWDADTRLQQANAMNLPHAGMASAVDVGSSLNGDQIWDGWHPKDKLDVGERLALWALKNDYGRTSLVTSGPILKDVSVVPTTGDYHAVVCSFDYVGSGLMVGSKAWYQPTQEVVGGTLQLFSIAGADNVWYWATATISGDTVVLSSTSVKDPKKVAYACWQNPIGLNLYNRDGLPASPFYVDDVYAKFTVNASAGAGGSISPAGATSYLKRHTALYTITPNAGYSISDVTVDGVSVGSVKSYTFDPIYANHTISATFSQTAPSYTVTTTGNAYGSVTPSGAVSVAQGTSKTFVMTPNTNCRLMSVTVDGIPVGRRNRVTFSDVRTNHTIDAWFAPVPTPGTGTGLRGDYFVGTNFDVFRLSRTDGPIGFDWGSASPDPAIPSDNFTARWTGTIEPQFTETYKFYLTHDDGAKLWVNGQLLVNNWNGSGSPDTGTISLTAGIKVPIKIEYNEGTSNAVCKLEWSSASIIREIVPKTQLYPATDALYTITSSAGTGGSLDPSGTILAYSGSNRTINVIPANGYVIADVKVDNVSQGAVPSYTFTNIVGNHTISATFNTLPSYAVSGKVTSQATGAVISGATVGFYNAPDSVGSPAYSATTNATGDYTVNIPMGTWYVYTLASGYFVSTMRTVTVGSAPVSGVNFALATATRNIPKTGDLLFSAVTDTFPASGNTGAWATYLPAGKTLATTGNPTVETINGVKWEKNLWVDNDGYDQGSYSSPIAVNGASIVVAVRPVYTSTSHDWDWRAAVDIFHDRLDLGVRNWDGKICVRRNGSSDVSATAIPDKQLTVLSLVVQPDGKYKVYANGSLMMDVTTLSAMTSLVPAVPGSFATNIRVGKSTDGWSTFNGNIGDVFVYKVALSDTERQQLETDIRNKFGIGTTYTINASAGTGGTITPSGNVAVYGGANQTFNITPNVGYAIQSVIVDGVSQGAISTYTFPIVSAAHTISATFVAVPTLTINASAGTGGSISPSGAVPINVGTDKTFVITPNAGYAISDVKVDNSSVGAVPSYTFTNITVNHTIAATFYALPTSKITASAGTGGTISPNGSVTVVQGTSQTFTITASTGYEIADVKVDNSSVGAVGTYTFNNVTADHTIAATFNALPVTVTGKVTDITTGAVISGASVYFAASPNPSVDPAYTATTDASGNYSQTLTVGTWYAAAKKAGYDLSADQTITVTAGSTPAANFALALTPIIGTEVFYKFNETTGTTATDSVSGKNGTLVNGPVWAAGKANNCLSFDGSNDYVSVPDLGDYAAMTISAWVNLDSLGADSTGSAIVACDGSDAGDIQFLILKSGGKMRFSLIGNTAADVDSNYAFTSADFGKWRHVAVVYDSVAKTVKFYVNGGLNTTKTLTTTRLATLSSGVRVGSWSGSRFFDGKIDEFHIYGRALSAAEIAAIVNSSASMRIADAKKLTNGEVVALANKVVTYAPRNASGGRNTNYFYIEEIDRSAGIMVHDGSTGLDSMNVDAPVTVSGVMRTISFTGQRYLELSTSPAPGTANVVTPLGMNTKSVLTDPAVMDLLVRVAGKVTDMSTADGWFNIKDGYGVDTLVICETGITLSGFAVGDTVAVTGAIGKDAVFTTDPVGIIYLRNVVKL